MSKVAEILANISNIFFLQLKPRGEKVSTITENNVSPYIYLKRTDKWATLKAVTL